MKQRAATPEEDWARGLVTEGKITKIEHTRDHWSITIEDGWTSGCSDERMGEHRPEVGDLWTTFGTFGYSFHGMALNHEVLWYQTPEEEEEAHRAMVAKMDDDKRKRFEEGREQLDRDYDSLPPLFKMRIDRFRNANPDFRWEHESYEMFVCTQAVLLGDWALEQKDGDKDAAVALIDEWNAINSKEHDPPYDYQAQLEMVPGWADGHSGNTHGCAVMLAKEHVRGSERVPLHMGALAPLVGTTDYSKP